MATSSQKAPAENKDSWEERYAMSGFFNISSHSQQKVADKRKRKGLGELQPRQKNVYGQVIIYSTMLGLVQTIGAPLERMRIIKQTSHMQNLKHHEKFNSSAASLFSKISSEQGISQFWRGNNANIYRSWAQMYMKIFFYDRIKQRLMPYDVHKYQGFDYFWRAAISFSLITALTTAVTYPLDLVHTRITTDMTKKGQTRLFTTTFDCFNRTNLDEGRWGLYKGFEWAVIGSILRASLTLPVYDTIKQSSLLKTNPKQKTMLSNFNQRIGASFISSLMLSLLLYPIDTMKRCQQLNGGRGQLLLYRGFFDGISKFTANQGYGAFYRGVQIFFVKEVICAFAQVNIYEMLGPHAFGIE